MKNKHMSRFIPNLFENLKLFLRIQSVRMNTQSYCEQIHMMKLFFEKSQH